MKMKIICGAGVFDLLSDERSPGVVIAESDYHGVLRAFAGESVSITSRNRKHRVRVPRENIGTLVTGLLDW